MGVLLDYFECDLTKWSDRFKLIAIIFLVIFVVLPTFPFLYISYLSFYGTYGIVPAIKSFSKNL
jgi:hypothetical protein